MFDTYVGRSPTWVSWRFVAGALLVLGAVWMCSAVSAALDSPREEVAVWLVAIALSAVWVVYMAATIPLPHWSR